MSMCHVLFMIWVKPFFLFVCSLHSLHLSMFILNLSVTSLHGSISQNLLSSLLFKLHSVELVLLVQLSFHHVCLSNLLSSLIPHLVNLSLVESFKVIWLDSVWSQHARFSGWVLRHKIMRLCKFYFMSFLVSPLFVLSNLPILLLLSHKLINSQCIRRILSSGSIMYRLCILQLLILMQSLLIKEIIDILLHLISLLLF